jgi:hypothetical protein
MCWEIYQKDLPNLDNGVADSPANRTPAGDKTNYQDEANAVRLPTHELSSFYDYFIIDAPSYISAPMLKVQP